jgi:hypothetical protein
MSLSALVRANRLNADYVVETQPAFFNAAPYIMMTITGGPVWIKLMVEYLDTAMTNATTTTILVNGVAADAGAVAINAGGIGAIVVSPLHAGAKNASAIADQWPDATGVATQAGFGMIAGPSALGIAVTFATVMAAANRYSLHVVYQKLGLRSLITPNY